MIELSEGVKQKAFYMAMVGYVATVMVIFFYYFNLNSLFFEIFSGVVSVLLFPIFFIAVLSRNLEPSRVTIARLEAMDIETYLKPISNAFSDKPAWLMLGLSLTLLYSFIFFFYWMAHSGHGVPSMEHGEYFLRNHTVLKAITKEKFDALKRLENMGMASHYLAFYAIAIWLLYKKEYLSKSSVELN